MRATPSLRLTAAANLTVGAGHDGCRSPAGLIDDVDDLQKVLQGAGETVELRHRHHIAGSDLVQHPVQFRPMAARPADMLVEDFLRSAGAHGRR